MMPVCEESGGNMNNRPIKNVSDSKTVQVHLISPKSLNSLGRLFGGELLGWIDEVAGIVARRHCGRPAVTASIEHMDFKSGAKNGDMIYICGRLVYVGNTSMQVRIDSYVESMEDGMRRMINTAFFVMVAVDDDGKPVQVPGLRVKTLNEQAEWEAGEIRKEHRKKLKTGRL